MCFLLISAILLALVAQSWTASLDILIDGSSTSTESDHCAGRNVTYICGIESGAHLWMVDNETSVNIGFTDPSTRSVDIYTVRAYVVGANIVSSLSFRAVTNLNGTNITCLNFAGLSEPRTAIASVLALPSAPSIVSVNMINLESFNVTIQPPADSVVCVRQYTLTISRNNTFLNNETINLSGNRIVDNLNLCWYSYTFQVVGKTYSEETAQSSVMAGVVDFSAIGSLSDLKVENNMVMWSDPTGLPAGCFLGYSLVLSGLNKTFFSTSKKYLLSEFGADRCSIQALTVTPIIFLTDQLLASSNVSETIRTSNPITSIPRVDDELTTSDAITIIFGVDSTGCSNITISTTINSTDGILQVSRPVLLSGNMYTASFSSLNPGMYSCNVSVISTTFGLIHSEVINCTTATTPTKPPGNTLIWIIIGIVCAVVAVVVFVAIIIVVVLLYKKGFRGKPTEHDVQPTSGIALQYDAVPHSDYKPQGEAVEYDAVIHRNQQRNGDNLLTYQAPESIKRQAAGTGGDIYTLPDKKDGKVNAGKTTQEIPMYSMPDKSRKQNQGLVYADIDVKKPSAAASRSRPPPPQPPGFTAEQDSGLVTYSSVQPRTN